MAKLRHIYIQRRLWRHTLFTDKILQEIPCLLPDIPRASLYRHIKVLLDAEIIVVVKEVSKRGSVEKTYAIAPKMPYEDTNRYFNGENLDPQRDLLTVRSASLMMSDEEMMEFITAYGQLIQKYLPNKPIGSRKVRKLTFVVSPNE